MVSLLVIILFVDAPQIHIRDTGLFQVMLEDEVYVHPNGEVYVLNFSESQIQHYAADGSLKQKIGGKGKGPGQFTFPIYFKAMNGHLYVQDLLTQSVSVYDMEGKYLNRHRLDSRNLTLQRTRNGWIFWTRHGSPLKGSPSKLEWGGDDFSEKRVLAKIADGGWTSGTWVMNQNGKLSAGYSPLEVCPQLAVSPDGSRCYYAYPRKFQIDVYDGSTGKFLQSIRSDWDRIPFDKEWAEEKLLEDTEQVRRDMPSLKIHGMFPEYFPAIREMKFDLENNLVVNRWRGRPDDIDYPIAFNAEGKEIPVKYEWNVLRRLAGVVGDIAYIIMFEEGGDAGIAKVEVANVNQFVKDYPVTDWEVTRNINISN
ncbi:MAG: 6-bladed beta-propeller [Acidobacteriota bacterium]|nr:6-bladed beta-propeller [Acidobacteriota bacterium]